MAWIIRFDGKLGFSTLGEFESFREIQCGGKGAARVGLVKLHVNALGIDRWFRKLQWIGAVVLNRNRNCLFICQRAGGQHDLGRVYDHRLLHIGPSRDRDRGHVGGGSLEGDLSLHVRRLERRHSRDDHVKILARRVGG